MVVLTFSVLEVPVSDPQPLRCSDAAALLPVLMLQLLVPNP